MTNTALIIKEAKLKNDIRNCRSCNLYMGCNSPIPFSGDSRNDLVVIGEAPGIDEDRQGKPFVGRSGLMLRKWMRDFGLRPTFMNSVSCYPHRTPMSGEVLACRGNLLDQLRLVKPKWILIVGAIPTSSFWPSLEFKHIRGLFWQAVYGENKSAWAISTYHPAAVLRNPDLEGSVLNSIWLLSRVVKGELRIPMKDDCIICGGEIKRELNGLGFCDIHWVRLIKKRWNRKVKDLSVQGELL